MARPSIPIQERLDKRMNRTLNCWYWMGKIDKTGYGSFGMKESGKSRTRTAHKIVYEVLVGLVPEGMQLDHLCRNRLCVNPGHLDIVTPRENTLRSEGIAALNARKTHCLHGHVFDGENTYIHPKRGSRHCRKCMKAASQKYQNKLK